MSFHPSSPSGHDHTFGHANKRPGEARTLIVIAITAVMMVVEIAAGLAFGSMALLADGLHMASHAAALGIAAFAYVYARRHASDPRFSFGTGKVNALAGFTSALLLLVFALAMFSESLQRLWSPVEIAFGQAILVAVLGLIVNGVSMAVLGGHAGHDHEHDDGHGHGHAHGADRRGNLPSAGTDAGERRVGNRRAHPHGHHGDHNLRAAYLHVLADALTSLLAIFALLAARYLGWQWMDPAMGIVGAVLVARWSILLVRQSGCVLLDFQGPESSRAAIRQAVELLPGSRVTDLHLWVIGPNLYALEMAVCSTTARTAADYRACLPTIVDLAHVNIEVHGPRG